MSGQKENEHLNNIIYVIIFYYIFPMIHGFKNVLVLLEFTAVCGINGIMFDAAIVGFKDDDGFMAEMGLIVGIGTLGSEEAEAFIFAAGLNFGNTLFTSRFALALILKHIIPEIRATNAPTDAWRDEIMVSAVIPISVD